MLNPEKAAEVASLHVRLGAQNSQTAVGARRIRVSSGLTLQPRALGLIHPVLALYITTSSSPKQRKS